MSQAALEDHVASARSAKVPSTRRIYAMWAGIAAVKIGAETSCPFAPEEIELADAFAAGVVMAIQARRSEERVFDLTPAHLRAYARAPVPVSYAEISAPREEE